MEKSTSIKNIAKALILFHIKVDKIPKDATNPFFKSKYATLSNILDAITIPLDECGLTFAQFPTGENGLCTIIMHVESGEYLQAEYFMHLSKTDPQAVGSAITYQRRYALAAILGLNIDEDDDDGNKASEPAKANNAQVTDNKPWLNKDTKEYTSLVARLKTGTATIKQAMQHFKISKAMLAELEKLAPINIKDSQTVPF
jgi:hypothetical protein